MDDNRIEGTAKKVAGTIQGAFGSATGNATQEAKGNAKKVAGAAQDAFGKAEDYVRESVDTVHHQITDKPVQSALIALGIGFLIGKLTSL